jgi:hypothetical protein
LSDFDDLLADGPAKKKIGRPSNADRAARDAAAVSEGERRKIMNLATQGKTQVSEASFFNPVGVNFLRRLLNMDGGTIKTRLRTLPPLPGCHPQRPLWHFHETLPYLVKPKMTAEQFAKTLNKVDLPPEINVAFWNSQRARVKYKVESQEAWETEDVLGILGEVAMTIKDSLTMVVEEMRNRAKLNDEQTQVLSECLDELRTEIRKKLVDMPAKRATPSMFGKPMFGVAGDIETMPDIPDEWADDDIEDEE